jgi:hypothetical protein
MDGQNSKIYIAVLLGKKPYDDQEAFDRLFERAQFHTHASICMSHAWPLETIPLSICLEREKILGNILSKLKKRNS